MKLLLDTHTFLWTILKTDRLPAAAIKAVQDKQNEVFVSAVSLWEISIKARLGKVDLINLTTSDLIPSVIRMGFTSIDLLAEEGATQNQLTEDSHFDPFDRMLVWQAISRKFVLVSGDKELKRFVQDGLKLLWN
jgi:PIN domain nuclease of toxin-antitoxin system